MASSLGWVPHGIARTSDVTASAPRTLETADWNPEFLFWITNTSGSEGGITEQRDLWILLYFHVQSFPIVLFRFLLCTPYFTIPTAQTASSKPRHQIPDLVSSFSARRITKFLRTPTWHSPTKKQGALIFLSVPLENVPSWCANRSSVWTRAPSYTRSRELPSYRSYLLHWKEWNNHAACSSSACWPDNASRTWQDLQHLRPAHTKPSDGRSSGSMRDSDGGTKWLDCMLGLRYMQSYLMKRQPLFGEGANGFDKNHGFYSGGSGSPRIRTVIFTKCIC